MFDTLMRYDAPTGKYVGGTAESLTPNADLTEWTMKLRANIKFNDGTPYDAAAVKWVLERQMISGNSAPRSQLTGAVDRAAAAISTSLVYTNPVVLKEKRVPSEFAPPFLVVP